MHARLTVPDEPGRSAIVLIYVLGIVIGAAIAVML